MLVFLVLLFEFRNLSAPVAVLASALLSTSGVMFALLITHTTFNISSFMGLIMVVGIVAKNGILLLDANQKFRGWGIRPTRGHDSGGKKTAETDCDDGSCNPSWNASPGFRLGRGFADVATAGHSNHRWNLDFDDFVTRYYTVGIFRAVRAEIGG